MDDAATGRPGDADAGTIRPDAPSTAVGWHSRGTVRTGGATVAYGVVGRGPGLVLVHGTGGSADTNWGHLAGRFSESRTVVAPDYAGSGETVDDGGPLELDDLAAQVIGAAEAAGAAPFDLVGYSLGAVVAAVIAAERPELVRSLVLVGCWVSSDPRVRLQFDLWQRLWRKDPELCARFLTLTGFGQPALARLTDHEIQVAVTDGVRTMAPGLERQSELDARVEIADRLGVISAPTLVVGMTRDNMVPVEGARRVHELIPASSYAEIDSGHLVVYERPDELVELVVEFIGGASRSSTEV